MEAVSPSIRFGTSGWRSVIAEAFTLENVRLVMRAIARCVKRRSEKAKLIVGYDTRFLAEAFAREGAQVLAEEGIEVFLCVEPVPTPAVAYAIIAERADGGVNITASHNPPEYQGIKFSTSDGASALPEITREIEEEIERLRGDGGSEDPLRHDLSGRIIAFDPREGYLHDLATKIDLPTIARARLRVVVDPLWGTARGYLDRILREAGCEVHVLHGHRDVLFGGGAPEPSAERLRPLCDAVATGGFDLGVATDGDADRFGIVDRGGVFVTPNQVLALLFECLCETRSWEGGVARSVATSHQVDRAARRRGRPVYETPVGFKYIGELLKEGKILIGGEESAGLSIRGHYPEKDGILAALLVAESVARTGASVSEQLNELYARDGRLWSGRLEIAMTEEERARLQRKLQAEPPADFFGCRILEVNRQDGLKLLLEDGSWVLLRLSGTEPLARCYAEATSEADLEVRLEQGRTFALC
jgi:phosphoglucomutase